MAIVKEKKQKTENKESLDSSNPPQVGVNREAFLNLLQAIKVAVTPKDEIDQSSCFVFQNGLVAGFDEEKLCRAKSGLGKDFLCVVRAKPILQLLDRLPDEKIILSLTDGELLVSGLNGRKSGLVVEREVRLLLSQTEDPGKDDWRNLPANFSEAIKLAAECTGSDDPKFWLTCVHVHPKYVEACDNKRILRYTVDLEGVINGEFLIRSSAAEAIHDLGMEKVCETQNWVHFQNRNEVVLSCRRWLDEFRDLGPVLESAKGGRTIELPDGLGEAAKRAAIFANEIGVKGKPKIMIRLQDGDGKSNNKNLLVRGEGPLGWLEEPFSVTYTGPTLAFMATPTLLSEIGRRSNAVDVANNKLYVRSDNYEYVALLSVPEQKPCQREPENVSKIKSSGPANEEEE